VKTKVDYKWFTVKSKEKTTSTAWFNKTTALLLVLLIPFFEPLCFFYLKDCVGFEVVGGFFDTFFMVYRACSVFLILIIFVAKTRFSVSLLLIILMGASMCLSVLVENESGLLKAVYESVTYISLGIFLCYEWRNRTNELISAGLILFVAFAVLSLASIVLTGASGIASVRANSHEAKDAIFFFGGKNSVFMYNLPALFFLSVFNYREKGNIGYGPIVLSLIFCVASIWIDSASSTFFFLVSLVFLVFFRFSSKGLFVRFFSQPVVLFVVFLLLLVGIVMMGNEFGILSGLLEFFGRSTTFSGRTGIWAQALSDVGASPFFGGGGALTFAIGQAMTPHAHSFYLNEFAQYGVFCFALFIIDAIFVSTTVQRHRASRNVISCIGIFMFYMLVIHSVFDFMSLPVYFLLRSCVLDGGQAFESLGLGKEELE